MEQFLSQGDVGMVSKWVLELQGAGVHGGVHAVQFGGALANLYVNDVGDGEYPNAGEARFQKGASFR